MLPGLLALTATASFGGGGYVLGPEGRALAVAVDGRHRVVIAGYAKEDRERAILMRFLPDGAIDPTFGGGLVRLETGTRADDRFLGVTVDPSGRIVASGSAGVDAGGARSVIARFRDDGTPDEAFGSGGRAIGREAFAFLYERAPGDGLDRFEAVAVDGKGRIVVAGAARGHRRSPRWGSTILCTWLDFGFCWSGETTTVVARFSDRGVLDESFASSGYVLGKRGGRWHIGAHDELLDLEVVGDRIIAVGWASGETYDDERTIIVALREDGLFDETFASGGFELSPPASFAGGTKEVAYGLAAKNDRITVAAFSFDAERHIVALTKTYDLGGKLVAHAVEAPRALADSDIEYFVKVALLEGGESVAVGFTDDEWAYDGDVDRAVLAMYGADGRRRASFSSHRNGRSVFAGEKDDAFHAVAADGARIYAAGTSDHRVLVARFEVDGQGVELR